MFRISPRALQALGWSAACVLACSATRPVCFAADRVREASAAEEKVARREDEIVRLRQRLFERSDARLAERRVELEVDLVRAEVASYRNQLREWDAFNRHFVSSKPFAISAAEVQAKLKAAEVRLELLEEQRELFRHHEREELKLRKLEIERSSPLLELRRDVRRSAMDR